MNGVKESKTRLSQGIIDLRVKSNALRVAQDHEAAVAALRANAIGELRTLQELKTALEPQIVQLADLDLAPVKNTGANLDVLTDAPNIIASLNRSISAQESIVSGSVDAATLLDAPQPIDTAAVIQAKLDALIEAVVKLSA